MSDSHTSAVSGGTSSPTLGSRQNFWAGDESPTSAAYDDGDDETDAEPKSGIHRDRWIAGSILRGAPETSLLHPGCWAELTDPEHYAEPSEASLEVPPWECANCPSDVDGDDGHACEDPETYAVEIYGDHRRYRECTDCGEVVWGGALQDLPESDLLAIADRILGALDARDSRLDDLRDAVETRKSGGMSDESIIERLVSDIRRGVDDDEIDTYE